VMTSIEGDAVLTAEVRADLVGCDGCNASTLKRTSQYAAFYELFVTFSDKYQIS
jgi:hypothetical protein